MTDGDVIPLVNNVFDGHREIDMHAYGKHLLHKGLSRPLMLICETVNYCNNSCIVCANSIMTREKRIMPMPLFRHVIDCYIAMGGGRLSLTPVVGDIFMDPYLLERLAILKEYRELGITSLSVTTNAVLARKYSSRDLRKIVGSFDKIFISVYGRNDEEYALMTRRNGFDEMLRSASEIIRLIDDKDRVSLGFRLLGDYTESELSTWSQKHFGIIMPFQAMNTYANWGKIDTSRKLPLNGKWLPNVENSTQCFIPLLALQVFSNGFISFCPCDDYDANEDLSLGHIQDTNLLQLYNSDKVRRLWNFEREMPSFCRRCSFHRPVNQLSEFAWVFERPLDFIGG